MATAGNPHADDLLEGYADLPLLQKVALGTLAELLLDLAGPPMPPEPHSMRPRICVAGPPRHRAHSKK